MFDRKDLFVGVLVVLAAFGTIVHRDGSFCSLIPVNRNIAVINLTIIVICLFGGSVASYCARGKLRPEP